ncbi:MAG TPA: hypothetical protein VK928_05450 [Longimicrobiales bacterium]|nr:hypothetical protein [Longimicrobiales bacterium]
MTTTRIAPGSEPLRFFATGATQHVFVTARDAEVVYKIPAVFPELRTRAFSPAKFKPVQPWKARLWAGVLRMAPGRLQLAGTPLLERYVAHRNRRRFSRMTALLCQLTSSGRGYGLLPFTLIDAASLLLDTPAGPRLYSGPVLVQQRAGSFVTRPGTVWVDTAAIIGIQHGLWEAGVGLDDCDTVVGPHNWALHAGRTYLGDTGSLTRDRERVRAMLLPGALDRTCEKVLRRCPDEASRRIARQHVDLLGQHITLEELERRWRTHS